MKKSSFANLFIILTAIISAACSQPERLPELKHGDLLFQDLNCGDLCDAIESVTEGVNGRDFSHCAMVVSINDTLKVVEAIGSGVQISSLESFYARSGDSNEVKNIVVARLKPEYRNLIDLASEFALSKVGKPYDDVYALGNETWYCSELVYESYRSASGNDAFFEVSAMTFKEPNSDAFFPAWVEYFNELGEEIPEGEPGLNPGSISRSEKLEIL